MHLVLFVFGVVRRLRDQGFEQDILQHDGFTSSDISLQKRRKTYVHTRVGTLPTVVGKLVKIRVATQQVVRPGHSSRFPVDTANHYGADVDTHDRDRAFIIARDPFLRATRSINDASHAWMVYVTGGDWVFCPHLRKSSTLQ